MATKTLSELTSELTSLRGTLASQKQAAQDNVTNNANAMHLDGDETVATNIIFTTAPIVPDVADGSTGTVLVNNKFVLKNNGAHETQQATIIADAVSGRVDVVQARSAALTTNVNNAVSAVTAAVENLQAASSGGSVSSVVVGTPVISCADTVVAGFQATFTCTAAALLEGATITQYNFAFAGVTVEQQSGTITITVPAGLTDGQSYTATCTATDSLGNVSRTGTCSVAVQVAHINTPSVTSPAVGSEVISSAGIALASSPYSCYAYADSHESSDWKIEDAAGNIVCSVTGSADKTQHTFTAAQCAGMVEGVVYRAFVRHRGTVLGVSDWSASVSFTARAGSIAAPAVTLASSSIFLDAAVTANTSAFSCTGNDIHQSTDWKMTSDAAGNDIVTQALGSSSLTSYTFAAGAFAVGTYYVWARHTGASYGASEWSGSATLIVQAPYVNAPSIVAPVSWFDAPNGIPLTVHVTPFSVTGGTDTQRTLQCIVSSTNSTVTSIINANTSAENVSSISETDAQ